MQTENLKCFFVWYVITCHPTTFSFLCVESLLLVPVAYLDDLHIEKTGNYEL